jgi:hypothetical protein
MLRAAIAGLVVIATIVAIAVYADSQHHAPKRLIEVSANH